MAAAAIVERPRVPSALPAGPPSRSSSSGTRSLQKSPVKTSLPGKVPPPGKAVVPAKPAPHPPVVTTQPAAVTLPPPVPGQPKKDGSPARKASVLSCTAVRPPLPHGAPGPGGVRLTARPSCLEEPLPEFGDAPVVLRCPQCFRLVQTRIELENGRFAKTTACMVCCSVVCCCCFWVPLYSDYFKDLYHVCPMCNGILFEKKRMG
ncbi:lipopolysaccharide-induced tumor necrosis factor-alpha factor homolog [Haemaphysalis longicornis]